MTWTETYRHTNGTDALYALPITTGAWSATGAVTGDDSAQSTLYVFTGLADDTEYEIFVRAGGSPAEGDDPLARISAPDNVSNVEISEESASAIADEVLAGIRPSSNTFTGSVVTPGQETITVYQRDDYSATDGRAFDFAIVDDAIDFSDAEVTIGPAGGQRNLAADRIAATLSLHDKADGSCTLRVEFTSSQLNKPAGQYFFNALILVDGRRLTKLDLIVNVETQNADVAS